MWRYIPGKQENQYAFHFRTGLGKRALTVQHDVHELRVVIRQLDCGIIFLHPIRLAGSFEEGTVLAQDILMYEELDLLLANKQCDRSRFGTVK